jgi:hypothetical protein
MYGYHNIRAQIGDLALTQLRELKVVQQFNDHARLFLTAVLPAGQADGFWESSGSNTTVAVILTEGADLKYLFRGLVADLTVKAVQDVYYLSVSGVSYTCNLDVAHEKRSFQNQALTYQKFVAAVLEGVAGANCLVNQSVAGQTTGRLILQYGETKWEVLKRTAAGLGLGLIADATANSPRFWFGLPEGDSKKALDNYHFSVSKKIAVSRELAADCQTEVSEADFVVYEVELDEVFQVGDRFSFRKQSLVVAEAIAEIKQGILKHRYVLTPERGLRPKPVFNPLITGLVLEGQVIAVENDQIKLWLDIDGNQDEAEAGWFSYATHYSAEGHTGWYCMPELGDVVQLYFPTEREENGYALSAIRRRERSGERLQDPAVKCFRTVNGAAEADALPKEWRFKPEGQRLALSGKDDTTLMIQIDDNQGVIISSDREIAITAKQDMVFNAGAKFCVTAGETIQLSCQTSRITLNNRIAIDGAKINRGM